MLRAVGALVGLTNAEDAAQEVVLRGRRAWPTLRDRASARTWLLSITVNLGKDWHRGRFGTRRRLDEAFQEYRDYGEPDADNRSPASAPIPARAMPPPPSTCDRRSTP